MLHVVQAYDVRPAVYHWLNCRAVKYGAWSSKYTEYEQLYGFASKMDVRMHEPLSCSAMQVGRCYEVSVLDAVDVVEEKGIVEDEETQS